MNTHPHKILVVDDEPGFSTMVAQVLNRIGGLEVHAATSKQDALTLLKQQDYDVIMTDIVMEDTDAGVELLEIAKQQSSEPIVILMTGNATVENAVAALRRDADDFLIKPSSVDEIRTTVVNALKRRDEIVTRRELLANIANTLQALSGGVNEVPLRPASATDLTPGDSDRYIVVGTLKVDLHTHQVWDGDGAIDLTPTQFAILATLARAGGRALTFDEIISTVQGYAAERDEARDLLRPHIRQLRLRLGKAAIYVRNVRGFGYYLAETESEGG